VDVLDGDQPNEVLMFDVVVEGHFRHGTDGLNRVDVVDLHPLLGLSDTPVRVLKDRQIELLFATEVVVDHSLGGAGALGDLVDTGTGIPLLGEHRRRDLDQFGPGALGVAQRLRTRLGGHTGELTGGLHCAEIDVLHVASRIFLRNVRLGVTRNTSLCCN
jgi:hypothetical protein